MIAARAGQGLIAIGIDQFGGNRIDGAEALHGAVAHGGTHHKLQSVVAGDVGELDHQRDVADLLLHGLGDAAHEQRIVA